MKVVAAAASYSATTTPITTQSTGYLSLYTTVPLLLVLTALVAPKITQHFYNQRLNKCKKTLSLLPNPAGASHRGGGGLFGPENTLYSIKQSLYDVGVDMIEIDVQRTSDGVFVLNHDLELSHSTDGEGYIRDKTFAEVQKLDAGYYYTLDQGKTYPLRGKGITLGTLDEVVEEIKKHPKTFLYLDIKQGGIIPDLLTYLDQKSLLHSNRVLFGAVPVAYNKEVMKYKPDHIPCTPDWFTVVLMIVALKLKLSYFMPIKHDIVGLPYSTGGFTALSTGPPLKILNKSMIDWAHSRGRKVYVFGPDMNHEVFVADAYRMGVDGVFSDRPDVVSKCLRNIRGEEDKPGVKTWQNEWRTVTQKDVDTYKDLNVYDVYQAARRMSKNKNK